MTPRHGVQAVASFDESPAMPTWWNGATPARCLTVPRRGVFRPGKDGNTRPGRLSAEWPCYLFAIFLSIQTEKRAREGKSRKARKARTGDTDSDTVK